MSCFRLPAWRIAAATIILVMELSLSVKAESTKRGPKITVGTSSLSNNNPTQREMGMNSKSIRARRGRVSTTGTFTLSTGSSRRAETEEAAELDVADTMLGSTSTVPGVSKNPEYNETLAAMQMYRKCTELVSQKRSSEESKVDRLLNILERMALSTNTTSAAHNQQQSKRANQEPTDPQTDSTCNEFENAKAPFELGEFVESQNKAQSTQIAGGKNFVCGITNFELVCLGERKYPLCSIRRRAQINLPVFEGRRQCRRRQGNSLSVSPWKGEKLTGKLTRRRERSPETTKSIWSAEEIKQDKYVQVAAGDDHTCALGLQGRVRCFEVFPDFKKSNGNGMQEYFGNIDRFQFGKIAKYQGVTKVAAGGATTCVIAAGKLSCHGYAMGGSSGVWLKGVIIPRSWEQQSFIDVAVGGSGICAIATDHSVHCLLMCKLIRTKTSCSSVEQIPRPLSKEKIKAAVVFGHLNACGILLETGLLECQNAQGHRLQVSGIIKNRKVGHLTSQDSTICVILSDNSELACSLSDHSLNFATIKKMGGMTKFRAAAVTSWQMAIHQRISTVQVVCGIGSDSLLHCNPQDFLLSPNVALRSRFVQTGEYTDGNQRDRVSELPFTARTPCETTCMGSGIASWACYKPETSCTSCKDNEHLTILDPLARAGTCTAKKCEYCKPRRCCDLRKTSDKIFYHAVAGEQGADGQGVCVNATDSCQANCIDTGNNQDVSMLCDKGCNKFNLISSRQMSICTARKHVACQRVKDPASKEERCAVDRTVDCRAVCPYKQELWAFGPTCALKVLQAGNTSSKVVAEVLQARHHCTIKSTSLIELIQKECTIEGCNLDSCIKVARTF